MLLFVLLSLIFPISPTSVENFLVIEGVKNYSVIPNVWYNSSFFISLKILNTSIAQPLNVNVSFFSNQSNAKVVFPNGNWIILSCVPKNNSCISERKEVSFMFVTKNASSFQLKLFVIAKLTNQSSAGIEKNIIASQVFSNISNFVERIKEFVLNQQNKDFLLLVLVFTIGILLGFFLSKRKKKIKSKNF